MMMKKLAAMTAIALFAATSASAADIDNTSLTNGTIQPFGAPDTATYGQVFTTGVGDTSINSFSMFLNGQAGGSLDFRGYLATWDGEKAGSLIYTSAVQTVTQAAVYGEFAFTPNVAVVEGQQYVAFLSRSGLGAQAEALYNMPATFFDSVLGGDFVFLNNGDDYNSLFTSGWNSFPGADVALKVDFSTAGAVPEPATWAMMIGGMGVVGGAMRRRRVSTKVSFA